MSESLEVVNSSESISTMDSVKSTFSKYKIIIAIVVVAIIVIAVWWFKPLETFKTKGEVDKLIDKIHRKQGISQKSS